MSFRGRYPTRFRGPGGFQRSKRPVFNDRGHSFKKHDLEDKATPYFRGKRGRSRGYFHRRDPDLDLQIDLGTVRGRQFSKRFIGLNVRSPRSRPPRGRHGNRGQWKGSSPRQRRHEILSDEMRGSPNEWLEEGPCDAEGSYNRLSEYPIEFAGSYEGDEFFDDCEGSFERRSRSPLPVHRDFDIDNEAFRKGSVSPMSVYRDFDRASMHSGHETCRERRHRSPVSAHGDFDRESMHSGHKSYRERRHRSHVSAHRDFDRVSMHDGHESYRERRHRSPVSAHRDFDRVSMHSGHESYRERRHRSPVSTHRDFDRVSMHSGHETCRERSHRSAVSAHRDFDRASLHSGHETCRERRSRSPFTVQTKGPEMGDVLYDRERSFERSISPVERPRSFKRKRHFSSDREKYFTQTPSPSQRRRSSERKRSFERSFSPIRRPPSAESIDQLQRGDREGSIGSLSISSIERQIRFEKRRKQMLEHQRRCHEKRSESSIERFLDDCKRSMERKIDSPPFSHLGSDDVHGQKERSVSPIEQHRTFEGLEHITIKRGKSFERSLSPVQRRSSIERRDEIFYNRERQIQRSQSPMERHRHKSRDDFIQHSRRTGRKYRSSERSPSYRNRDRVLIREESLEKRSELSYASQQRSLEIHISNDHFLGVRDRSGRGSEFTDRPVNENTKQPLKRRGKSPEIRLELSPVSRTGSFEKAEFLKDDLKSENMELSLISQPGSFEKGEFFQKNEKYQDNKLALSPISAAGSFEAKRFSCSREMPDNELELSPISQPGSFEKREFSQDQCRSLEKISSLSPVSEGGSFEMRQVSSDGAKRKGSLVKRPASSDSMNQFLAELERSCDRSQSSSRSSSSSDSRNLSDSEKPYKIVPDVYVSGYKKVYLSNDEVQQSTSPSVQASKNLGQVPFYMINDNDDGIEEVSAQPSNIGSFSKLGNTNNISTTPTGKKIVKEDKLFNAYDHIFEGDSSLTSEPERSALQSIKDQFHSKTNKFQNNRSNQSDLKTGGVFNQQVSERPNQHLPFYQSLERPMYQGPEMENINISLAPSQRQNVLPHQPTSTITNMNIPFHHNQGMPKQTTMFYQNQFQHFNRLPNQNVSLQKMTKEVSNQYETFPKVSSLPFNRALNPTPNCQIQQGSALGGGGGPVMTGPFYKGPEAYHRYGQPSQVPIRPNNASIFHVPGGLSQSMHQVSERANLNLRGPNQTVPLENLGVRQGRNASFNHMFLGPNQDVQFCHNAEISPQNQLCSLSVERPNQSRPIPVPQWPERPNQSRVFHQQSDRQTQRTPFHLLSERLNENTQHQLLEEPKQSVLLNKGAENPFLPPLTQTNQISAPIQNNIGKPSSKEPSCVDIKHHLSGVFGPNYITALKPNMRDNTVLCDDESVPGMSQQYPVVLDTALVERYRNTIPSSEVLEKMLEGFVIFVDVRFDSQIEKNPLTVIQDSFDKSDRFGKLDVEVTKHGNSLQQPKQVCVLRWHGVMLAREEGTSREEAQCKAGIALINSLAHTCYTVQAKKGYYCGGKLPKFILKEPEKPGVYKVVPRDEVISAVTDTLKILRAQNILTKGVDATHINIVLKIIDDFFRDKNTHCELLFGGKVAMEYLISEVQKIVKHVEACEGLRWRKLSGYGRGSYIGVWRSFTPQQLCSYVLSQGGDTLRYRVYPPQGPRVDLLLADREYCQYSPDMVRFQTQAGGGAQGPPDQSQGETFKT